MALALVHRNTATSFVQERHVTAVELQKSMLQKKIRDVHGHSSILSSCYRKIKRVAGIDETSCLFEVPEFVMGCPPFDLSRAVSHVMTSLEHNGFTVAYMFPRALLISWDSVIPSDGSLSNGLSRVGGSQSQEVDSNVMHPSFPNLPFSQTDSSERRDTGKLGLGGYRSMIDFKPKGRFIMKL